MDTEYTHPNVETIIVSIVSEAENYIHLLNDMLALRGYDDVDYDALIQIRKDMQKLIHDQLWTQSLYMEGKL